MPSGSYLYGDELIETLKKKSDNRYLQTTAAHLFKLGIAATVAVTEGQEAVSKRAATVFVIVDQKLVTKRACLGMVCSTLLKIYF